MAVRAHPHPHTPPAWLLAACLLLVLLCLESVQVHAHSSAGAGAIFTKGTWQRPGCHKVGHTRKISIPDCVEFPITTNACRGYCESWSVPSTIETLITNPHQPVTSVGQCCNIMETEDVYVRVMCLDGVKDVTFKSAKSCSCYHCKKD